MMTDSEHRAIEGLLGAYALDAVDPDEARLVGRHLEECPRCRIEVDSHRMMGARLGNSVLELPGNLWDRIAEVLDGAEGRCGAEGLDSALSRRPGRRMRPVSRRNSTLPRPGGDGRPGSSGMAAADGSCSSGARIAGARRPHRGRSPRAVAVVGGAVGVAAVAVATVLGMNLASVGDHVLQLNRAVTAEGATATVTAALRTPGHQVVHLTAPDSAVLASLVLLPDGRGFIVSSRMPALRVDETYQLWARVAGRLISAGLLGRLAKPASGFTIASGSPTNLTITVEPAGGVTTPSAVPVAEGMVLVA